MFEVISIVMCILGVISFIIMQLMVYKALCNLYGNDLKGEEIVN